jgi:hypothetical protein
VVSCRERWRVLREALRELGENDDELAMSLDLAASDSGLTFIASEGGRPVGVLIALTGAVDPVRLRPVGRAVAPDARRRAWRRRSSRRSPTPGLERSPGWSTRRTPIALGFWQDRGWTVRRPRPGRRRLLMSVDLPEVRSEAA